MKIIVFRLFNCVFYEFSYTISFCNSFLFDFVKYAVKQNSASYHHMTEG